MPLRNPPDTDRDASPASTPCSEGASSCHVQRNPIFIEFGGSQTSVAPGVSCAAKESIGTPLTTRSTLSNENEGKPAVGCFPPFASTGWLLFSWTPSRSKKATAIGSAPCSFRPATTQRRWQRSTVLFLFGRTLGSSGVSAEYLEGLRAWAIAQADVRGYGEGCRVWQTDPMQPLASPHRVCDDPNIRTITARGRTP